MITLGNTDTSHKSMFDKELLVEDMRDFCGLYKLLLDPQMPNVERLLSKMDTGLQSQKLRDLFLNFRFFFATIFELVQRYDVDQLSLDLGIKTHGSELSKCIEIILLELQDILKIIFENIKAVGKSLEVLQLFDQPASLTPAINLRLFIEENLPKPRICARNSQKTFKFEAKFDFLPESRFLMYKFNNRSEFQETEFCFNRILSVSCFTCEDGWDGLLVVANHELSSQLALHFVTITEASIRKSCIEVIKLSKILDPSIETNKTCRYHCEYPTAGPTQPLRLLSILPRTKNSLEIVWEDGERLPGCWIVSTFDISSPNSPQLIFFNVEHPFERTVVSKQRSSKPGKKGKSKSMRKESLLQSPPDTPPKKSSLRVIYLPPFVAEFIGVAQLPGLLLVTKSQQLFIVPLAQPEQKVVFQLSLGGAKKQTEVVGKRVTFPVKYHLSCKTLSVETTRVKACVCKVSAVLGVGFEVSSDKMKWASYILKYTLTCPEGTN